MHFDLSTSTRAALDTAARWLVAGAAAFVLVACGGDGGGGVSIALPGATGGTPPAVEPPPAEPPPAGTQKSFHCAPEPLPA